ncbi:MAG TPA: SIS domain-containing protein [Dehalococcoidia bacterium]|nr:SIS domain-containing protein [Dehalococcoidia bacterium]
MSDQHDERGAVNIIGTYFLDVSMTLDKLRKDRITSAVEVLNEAREKGKRIYTFGNGGSAATASHIACDLAKGAAGNNRPGLRAFSLNDSIPLTTAWANDTDYENVFSARLIGLVDPGDVIIAISGSGNSPNVLNGVNAARLRGATTIGLSGFDGGKLSSLVDIAIVAHVNDMEQVEDVHLLIGHVLTACLRQAGTQQRNMMEAVREHSGALVR